MYFQPEGRPNDVLNFGKYEGRTFAAVYLRDPSSVEWVISQDKCRMWKLKCFKFFLRRLSDLEHGARKRTGGNGGEGNKGNA